MPKLIQQNVAASGATPEEAGLLSSQTPDEEEDLEFESAFTQELPKRQSFRPADESEEALFADTDRPQEAVTAGAGSGRPPAPRNAERWLPALVLASLDPDAPPQLRTLVRLLLHQLERP